MIRLLIADDDEIMLQRLRHQIPWEKNGFEIVGAAKDGKEAYEMVLSACPDIVLTDINMPFLSGFELAEKIRLMLRGCKIVFLTGYDDFAYARQAVRLHADDYILKIESEEKIMECMNRVRQQFLREKDIATLTEMGLMARKRLQFERLLRQDCPLQEQAETQRALSLNLEQYCYRLAAMTLDSQEARASVTMQGMHRLSEAVDRLLLTNRWMIAHTLYQQYMILLLQLPDNAEETARGHLHAFLGSISPEGKNRYCVGVSRALDAESTWSELFDEAIMALPDRKADEIVFFREQSRNKMVQEVKEYVESHYMEPELSLTSLSQALHFSSAYLSSLFKRYSGTNFKDYLIRFRMEKAGIFMRQQNLKTYEVAEMVGYTNAQYFSVLFRKHYGMTPSDYRRAIENGPQKQI
mgnify:CR=1 FL=1